jgi:hypothetical protein
MTVSCRSFLPVLLLDVSCLARLAHRLPTSGSITINISGWGTGFLDLPVPLNGVSLIRKLVNLTRECVSQVNPGTQKSSRISGFPVSIVATIAILPAAAGRILKNFTLVT